MRLISPNLVRASLCLFYACMIILFAGPMRGAAQDGSQLSSEPIAIIGTSVILESEVERTSTGRPRAYAELPADERRARIINMLLAEYVIDYFYGRDTTQVSSTVLEAVNDARRQVLLQFYAKSQFTPPAITDEDVEAFTLRNADLFGGRRSYNFAIVTLTGGTAEAREALQVRFSMPEPEIAALEEMVAVPQNSGVATTLNTVWQPSEALGDAVLLRLNEMVRDNLRTHIIQERDSTSILLLNSAVPIPADPAMLRSRIEQRLTAEAFDVHREKLIRRMAMMVLEPSVDSAEDQTEGANMNVTPPPRGSVVWSNRPVLSQNVQLAALFGVGFFGVLAGYFLWLWRAVVSAQYRKIKSHKRTVPFLQKRNTAFAVTAFGALGLLYSLLVVIPIAFQTLGETTTWLLFGTGIAAAVVIANIWSIWRNIVFRVVEKEDQHSHWNNLEAYRFLLRTSNSLRMLAATASFFVLYSTSYTFLMDGLLGFS